MFTTPTCNRITRPTIRVRDRRTYLVTPVVMARAGVMHGSNEPIYYPSSELRKAPHRWNNIPLTLGHPKKNGRLSFVRDAGRRIGFVDKVIFQSNRLRGEAWMDLARTPKFILDRVNQGKAVGVSTGLITQVIPEIGVFGGRAYESRLVAYRPDHLAVLVNQIGACSVSDGCGLIANNSRGIEIPSSDFMPSGLSESPLELPQLFD